MTAMKKFESWADTPVSRERNLQDGKWVDVTRHFLGRVGANAPINICCSFEFWTRVLKGNLSKERVLFLNKQFVGGENHEFEMKIGKEVFKCNCIRTIENFRGQKTICYNFFEGRK